MNHNINLGEWKLDIETHLIHFSPLKAQALGYTADEIPDYVTYEFFIEKIYVEDFSKVRDLFLDLILGEIDAFDVVYQARTKQGGSKWFHEICQVTTKSETGKPLIASGVTWDITEEKRLESKPVDSDESDALRLSDHLTQISNREGLFEKLKAEVEKSFQNTMFLSVSLCEIRDFNHINEVEGHIFGDYLLIRMADLLIDGARETDSVGRYMADKFMIVFPLTPREIASELMQNIVETIENYEFGCKQEIKMTFVVKEYMGEVFEEFIEALEHELKDAKA